MTAQTVYSKVVGLAFIPFGTATNLPQQYLDDLSSGIGELRQLLSCVVCCRLLVDPFGPNGKDCQHYVCRLCVGGSKRLVPRCSQCEDCLDFETYKENRPIATQLHCYQALCVHLLLQQSSMLRQLARQFPDLSHVAQCPRIRLPRMTTKQFLREGYEYDPMPPTTAAAQTPAVQTPSFQSEDFYTERNSHLSEAFEIGQVFGIEAAPQPAPLAKTTAEVEVLQENVSQEEAHWENVSDDEEYFGDVSQEEAFLENMSEETFMDSVTQEASLEIVSQDVLQESGSQATSRESIVEELYKEITSKKASQEQSAWDGMYQEIPRSSASQDIDLPEASQQLNSSQEYTPSTKYRKKDTEMTPFNSKPIIISNVQLKPPRPVQAIAAEAPSLAPVQGRDQEPVPVPKPNQEGVYKENSQETASQVVLQESGSQATSRESIVEELYKEITSKKASQEKSAWNGMYQEIPRSSASQDIDLPEASQQLNSSQEYAPSTTKYRKKDTKLNPFSQVRDQEPVAVPKPTLAAPKADLKCYASTDTPSNTTGSPRRNAGNTKNAAAICRCGSSAKVVNQKTTCRNNRCRCYVSGNSCTNCHCFGCHNPHKTDFLDSDDEDELENVPPPSTRSPQSEKKPAPTEAVATETETKQTALGGSQGNLNLVLVNNLEQSQHPLVLIEKELGEYQGYNLFQGSEPIDPATVGFLRVKMQNVNSTRQIAEYAYVIPPPPVVP
ncbi:GL16171 [Drosophila persimilis]|uniref:GL16171 n=1 Tax=Drosophila persimilis TaxID=7234 RepID=B4H5K5_DROPE|nr:E3 ubiquitin-protein ligase msl-2 [Drosophila persimilis]EDW33057.1 GL16171 [Drosophila persimilis]